MEVLDLAGSDTAIRFWRVRAVLPRLPGPREVGCGMSELCAVMGAAPERTLVGGLPPRCRDLVGLTLRITRQMACLHELQLCARGDSRPKYREPGWFLRVRNRASPWPLTYSTRRSHRLLRQHWPDHGITRYSTLACGLNRTASVCAVPMSLRAQTSRTTGFLTAIPTALQSAPKVCSSFVTLNIAT